MIIKILTLFPEMYDSFLNTSIISRIIKKELVQIQIINIRDYSKNKHHHVDDTPYGGGPGMLMKVDVLHNALINNTNDKSHILLTTPKSRPLVQDDLLRLSKYDELVIACGHYEGIDYRFEKYVDEKINIGDYILTGGELPSMILIDGISRLLDNGINDKSLIEESFNNNLLEYPQYTRPVEYDGSVVPNILLNGNHKEINKYNLKMSLKETLLNRPDLLEKHEFTKEEKELLGEVVNEL